MRVVIARSKLAEEQPEAKKWEAAARSKPLEQNYNGCFRAIFSCASGIPAQQHPRKDEREARQSLMNEI
jgi:hypothetical protein